MELQLAPRRMTAEDLPAGLRLCRACRWNQLVEDWRMFLDSPGSAALVMEKDNRIVGTSAFLHYDAFAWIAMVMVDPDERRAGIGGRLMEEALAALGSEVSVGLDATPAGEPVYRRFGFESDFGLIRMKARIDAAGLGSATGNARPIDVEDLAGVLLHDREVFGGDRSRLLVGLLERAPECAWIAADHGQIQGYCFGRPGALYRQLGPIVAGDAAVARSLAAACLSRQNGELLAIDAPRLDEDWLAWLRNAGFNEERPFVRMFRAGSVRPGVPARQYAIAGPEFA